jgi:hypothetical protein
LLSRAPRDDRQLIDRAASIGADDRQMPREQFAARSGINKAVAPVAAALAARVGGPRTEPDDTLRE